MTETLDIEEVRRARAKERERSSPVEQPEGLFEEIDAAVTSDEVDIEQLHTLTAELVDERLAKVVKLASFAAAGLRTNTDGLTESEEELLADLEARLNEHREDVIPDVEVDDA